MKHRTKSLLLGLLGCLVLRMVIAQSPADSAAAAHQRVAAKVERVKELMHKSAESGRDPSAIARMMEGKVKPLLEAGDFVAADLALDRVLAELKPDEKSASSSAAPAEVVRGAGHDVPEEARRQMRHNIDSTFVVFRDKIQEELKVTKEQNAKLETVLPGAMQFLQKIQRMSPEERKKELKEYRPQVREKLAAVLKETLNEGQRARLRQIVLQREGLRNGEIWPVLHITEEQQQRFIPLMQQAQKETQALMAGLHESGQIKEIQPKVIKVREDLESQLVSLLTDAQKKQWHEMLGQPMAVSDLFDL